MNISTHISATQGGSDFTLETVGTIFNTVSAHTVICYRWIGEFQTFIYTNISNSTVLITFLWTNAEQEQKWKSNGNTGTWPLPQGHNGKWEEEPVLLEVWALTRVFRGSFPVLPTAGSYRTIARSVALRMVSVSKIAAAKFRSHGEVLERLRGLENDVPLATERKRDNPSRLHPKGFASTFIHCLVHNLYPLRIRCAEPAERAHETILAT